MPLQSNLFRGDPALEACLTQDTAHVVQGAVGIHVGKLQLALAAVDDADIDAVELEGRKYGPSTASAVLAYKTKRNVINFSYQTQADNIVGKMTIAALDKEVFAKEKTGPGPCGCRLTTACPSAPPGGRGPQLSFAIGVGLAGAAPRATDAQLISKALQDSRNTRLQAIGKLNAVITALGVRARTGKPLSTEDQRVFSAAVKWLSLKTRADLVSAVAHMQTAANLLSRSLIVKNSAKATPTIKRVPGDFHGQTDANPDHGVECGSDFFDKDGPLCRRDVITHEFLHFLGVKHGGAALNGPTIRANITTPALALDSADNLAQLVSELTTVGAKTDSCPDH
jgi:hypothetical protein